MGFKLPKNVSRALSKTILKVRKASPALLVVAGVGAMIGGTVLACKAARHIDEPIDEARREIEEIHDMEETNEEFAESKEPAKAKLKTWTKLLLKMGKIFGPAIIATGIGVACILGGYNILNKRYLGLAAAHSALMQEALISNAKFESEASKQVDPKTGEVVQEPVKKFAPNVEYYYAEPNENSLTPMGAYAFKFDDVHCYGCHGYEMDYLRAISNIKYIRETLEGSKTGYFFFDRCLEMFGVKIPADDDGRNYMAMSKCVGWMRQEGKTVCFKGERKDAYSIDPKVITAYEPVTLASGDTLWKKYIIIDPMSMDPEATYFGPILERLKACKA